MRAGSSLAAQLREQARSCAAMGSPLYAALLDHAAQDAERGGPVQALLAPHARPGRGGALALRLMAAVHRLVLIGRLPQLEPHYPSAGGDAGRPGAGKAFRRAVADHAAELSPLVAQPCQTNEPGRCAALIWGFLDVASRTRLPLRLLEIGASAGLNLRWDRYRYSGGGAAWGDPHSPVDLSGLWVDAPEHVDAGVQIAQRRGCDPAPVDPLTQEGRLALRSAVWADQPQRLARLDGALRIAADVPVELDRASAADWLPARVAEPAPGAATIIYHSVVQEYLDEVTASRFRRVLDEAGAAATADAPVAWLRLEPASALRAHALTLTTWPGGRQRALATSGAHGSDVRAIGVG